MRRAYESCVPRLPAGLLKKALRCLTVNTPSYLVLPKPGSQERHVRLVQMYHRGFLINRQGLVIEQMWCGSQLRSPAAVSRLNEVSKWSDPADKNHNCTAAALITQNRASPMQNSPRVGTSERRKSPKSERRKGGIAEQKNLKNGRTVEQTDSGFSQTIRHDTLATLA